MSFAMLCDSWQDSALPQFVAQKTPDKINHAFSPTGK